MTVRPKLRDETADKLREIQDTHDYGSLDEAVTHVLRERESNVVVAFNQTPMRAFTSWELAQEWRDYWAEEGAGDEYKLVEVIMNDMPEVDEE